MYADNSTSDYLLRTEAASRTFTMGEVEVHALANADLTIAPGELVVILGPSGSGKSTLLNLIGGIDRATSGKVWYQNTDLSQTDDAELTEYRREKVGFIFQFYNLVPTLTAEENVQVAVELAQDPIPARVALEMVGLADRADHFPAQLSGGEQQRVAIARAISKKPELLLADEPTGALDLEMARGVLKLLQKLNSEQNLTCVIITHNPAIARIAGRTVRIVSGRIAETSLNDNPIPAEKISW